MKKLLTILAIGFAVVANADYLYWMVDPGVEGTGVSGGTTSFDWDKAVLKYEENNTVMEMSSTDAALYNSLNTYAIADIGAANDYSGRSYFIELYNGDQWLAASEHKSASSLADYIFGNNSMSPVAAAAFGKSGTAGTYSVPEPTSGLLFLVGGMLLGLKRRRQQV